MGETKTGTVLGGVLVFTPKEGHMAVNFRIAHDRHFKIAIPFFSAYADMILYLGEDMYRIPCNT